MVGYKLIFTCFFALVVLSELGGEAAPAEWQGAFNCTYNFGGPGFRHTSAFNNR